MAMASSVLSRACGVPTALRCWTWQKPQRVRDLGWRGPILLLEGVFEQRDLELCSRLDLWHTVHCEEQIDMLAIHKTNEPHRVFLKVELRHEPLGLCSRSRCRSAWTRLNALPQVDEISLMTHFSDADGPKGIAEPDGRIQAQPLTTCPVSAPSATARPPCAIPGPGTGVRLGARRHCHLWQCAGLPGARRRRIGACSPP